jgi:hypothetical protein
VLVTLPEGDPRVFHQLMYDWLGGLQWRLLRALG